MTDSEYVVQVFQELADAARDAECTHEELADMLEKAGKSIPLRAVRAGLTVKFAAAALTGLIARSTDTIGQRRQADIVQTAWEIAQLMMEKAP